LEKILGAFKKPARGSEVDRVRRKQWLEENGGSGAISSEERTTTGFMFL
jgi:hypothetical protein